jgi:DNA repair and recombination protein RAD54 and RAD54-like protein
LFVSEFDLFKGFVYRFIATGTIEEKIFQRQANKQALSSCVVDEKEDTERHFSIDALRKLFLFNENTLCETHETFKCKRCKNGRQLIKSQALLYGDASTYVVSYTQFMGWKTDCLPDGTTLRTKN